MKKKFAVLGIFAFLSFINVQAKYNCYTVQHVGDKPWGCAYPPTETSEPNGSGGTNFYITCIGAGEIICQFKDGTCPLIVTNTGEDIAEQVVNGVLNGTVGTEWGSYTWTGTDIENYSYTVTVDEE